MIYYVIRRVKDKLIYGRNMAFNQTGNNHPRQGWGEPFKPYLYSTEQRAKTALSNNLLLMVRDGDIEIMSWNTLSMKRVWTTKLPRIKKDAPQNPVG